MATDISSFSVTRMKGTGPPSVLHQVGRELELIQSHMAQKPVLRGEVGCACSAREVSSGGTGMNWRGS